MRKLIESYNNGYGPGNGGNGNGAPGSGNNGGNGNNSNGGNGNGSPKRPSILMLILSGLMTVIVVLMCIMRSSAPIPERKYLIPIS